MASQPPPNELQELLAAEPDGRRWRLETPSEAADRHSGAECPPNAGPQPRVCRHVRAVRAQPHNGVAVP
eukprot:9358027-Lingulodinium_polyedra.AAC.1